MLLCFCHDCDINDGSASNPYFAGESLMVCIYPVYYVYPHRVEVSASQSRDQGF
jgi:hypothetical protein